MRRFFLLPLLAIALASCGGSPPKPRNFAPLSYDYLNPIRLNVAAVQIDNRFVPASRDEVSSQAPIPPLTALRQMASDRLKALGTSGRAVFVIKDASLVRQGDTISGKMSVQLDIYASDDRRAGFASAEVTQRRSGDSDDLQATLYDLTKEMMDKMNVELEFQTRRSLRDWLLPDVDPAAAKVQQQDLAAPKK